MPLALTKNKSIYTKGFNKLITLTEEKLFCVDTFLFSIFQDRLSEALNTRACFQAKQDSKK